jgi:hypothetical protein
VIQVPVGRVDRLKADTAQAAIPLEHLRLIDLLNELALHARSADMLLLGARIRMVVKPVLAPDSHLLGVAAAVGAVITVDAIWMRLFPRAGCVIPAVSRFVVGPDLLLAATPSALSARFMAEWVTVLLPLLVVSVTVAALDLSPVFTGPHAALGLSRSAGNLPERDIK